MFRAVRSAVRGSCCVFCFFLLVFAVVAGPARASNATQSDQAFVSALGKADQNGLEPLLDPEFTWTDRNGKTRTKAEILPILDSLRSDADTDTKIDDHGGVVLIRGSHRTPSQSSAVRFARVWVQRPEGWKLLIYQETNKADKTPEKRSGFGSPSNGAAVACENPCDKIPYQPEGAPEKEIVAMWQGVERTV
jgi:hypothetical protein